MLIRNVDVVMIPYQVDTLVHIVLEKIQRKNTVVLQESAEVSNPAQVPTSCAQHLCCYME